MVISIVPPWETPNERTAVTIGLILFFALLVVDIFLIHYLFLQYWLIIGVILGLFMLGIHHIIE